MSRVCELTGRRPTTGNRVSHSNIKTRTRWLPNLKSKKFFIPELQSSVTLNLSTRGIKTIDKHGSIVTALLNAKECCLSERLLKLKRSIKKARSS